MNSSDYDSDNYVRDDNTQDIVDANSTFPQSSKELSSDEIPELVVEVEKPQVSFNPTGRRIVDIQFLFQSLQSFKHNGFNCTFCDVEIIKEQRLGFRSIFTTKCKMCNQIDTLSTEDPTKSQLDVTTAAVSDGIENMVYK
ncbi:hypothetical protein RN001_014935 [Aquatica leii]|uniref:Mutator-like transposase domain-containing protein n=1 Tax=Aquatica leii TaxID=1421715 RepID=A0AAN7P0A6_9COLE|nr:hypothetical protein RN001_014935 [Aquatica leii]